jgi:hypothetical protein
MFAMLFTLFVAILAATLWALRSFLFDSAAPHDASTFELATIGLITLATYVWMKRLQEIRTRTARSTSARDDTTPARPVPIRYAEAVAEAEFEESRQSAEHVA